jgi:integrase
MKRKPNRRSSIYLGGDGKWHGYVTMGLRDDGSPDRRHRVAATESEVTAKVRELERRRDAGAVGKPGRAPTVEEWMTYWLTTILPVKGSAPRTIDDYWSKCRIWIFPNLGKHRLDRCQPEHFESLYAKMQSAGKAPSHIRKVHAILSSAYATAVKRGKIARNPLVLVDPPSAGNPEKEVFTLHEVRTVLTEAARRPNAARWSVGLALGLRQGETLGLRWQHLDLDIGAARIVFQLQRLKWRHGCADPHACGERLHRVPCARRCRKHRHQDDCLAGCTKRGHTCPKITNPCPPDCTKHAAWCPQRQGGGLVLREIKERRHKVIPVPPELVAILREHQQAQALERALAGGTWTDHDFVFCQPNGQPIDPRHDWQEWADILKSAGLEHRGVHAQRHTAATLLLDQGVALAVVQEMLGHADIRVTRGYTHVSSPLTIEAARRMGAALWEQETATGTATGDDAGHPQRERMPSS